MPTLFCDLGGVVFDDSAQRALDAWREANGGDLAITEVEELRDRPFRDFQRGCLTEADYLVHVRSVIGWKGTDDELIEHWKSSAGSVRLDTVDLLGELRDSGWRLIAATNADPWRIAAHRATTPWVWTLFDRVVSSLDVGACKPDSRFFAELTRGTSRLDAQLFVDDRPHNVAAARRAGLDGHLFTGAAGLRSVCRQLASVTDLTRR